MSNPFAAATREAEKLRIAFSGPSGAGKTLGALVMARTIIGPSGRLAVIDTENGSAALYAKRELIGPFDHLRINPPYLTSKFQRAVKAAIDHKYDAVVIDSITHQWDGVGGILQRKEAVDARGGNHFSNWAPFTKEHNEFRALLLEAPIHLFVTMRSKQAYQVDSGDGKKAAPKKLGLQPIQREGMEYEFTLTFDVQMDHMAAASKDRTGLFDGQFTNLLSTEPGEALLGWLADGAAPAPLDDDDVTDEQRARVLAMLQGANGARRDILDEALQNAGDSRAAVEKVLQAEGV